MYRERVAVDSNAVSPQEVHPLAEKSDRATAQYFTSARALAEYHREPKVGLRYGRDASAPAQALEAFFEKIYPGFRALTFSTGMSAISTAMITFASPSRRLYLQSENYRKNRFLAQKLYPMLWDSVATIDAFSSPLNKDRESDSFFLEAPSNPHLKLPRIEHLSQFAKGDGLVILDSTMAGIGNEKPLLLDAADIVIHSLTKYSNGYNDSFGGLVLVREGLYGRLWDYRSALGTIMNPDDASTVLTHLKTYRLRFEQQTRNAESVVGALTEMVNSGRNIAIYYPGTGNNASQSDLASATLKSYGSVVSFVPEVRLEELEARVRQLRVFRMAPSFGSVDSLFEFPRTMSLANLSDTEVADLGIASNLVRMSIGIEDCDLVLDDLRVLLGDR